MLKPPGTLRVRSRWRDPADASRFVDAVPGSTVVSIDANHFGIVEAPATSEAIRTFPRTRTA